MREDDGKAGAVRGVRLQVRTLRTQEAMSAYIIKYSGIVCPTDGPKLRSRKSCECAFRAECVQSRDVRTCSSRGSALAFKHVPRATL